MRRGREHRLDLARREPDSRLYKRKGSSVATYLPITKARDELTSLPERRAKKAGAVAVTRRGEPVLAILLWELYEALEILGDEELMAALRQSLTEAAEGNTLPWQEVQRKGSADPWRQDLRERNWRP